MDVTENNLKSFDSFADTLKDNPGNLLLDSVQKKVHNEAISSIKNALDKLALKYSILDSIHTDGLDDSQIWEQSRMVIDGAFSKLISNEIPNLKTTLSQYLEKNVSDLSEEDLESVADIDSESDIEDLNSLDIVERNSDSDLENSIHDDDDDDDDDNDDEAYNSEDDEKNNLKISDDDLNNSEISENETNQKEKFTEQKDPFGLNDGFFSLEEFNKQSIAAENNKKSKYEITNDDDEDEDQIDYFADLDAQDFDDEDDEDDDSVLPEEMTYEDFFAPPKQLKDDKKNKKQKLKNNHNNHSNEKVNTENNELDEDELDKAMQNVQKDLYNEDEEDEEEEEEKERNDLDNANSNIDQEKNRNLSKFEKSQRKILQQIRELEAENIKPKSWQLSGEASSADRELNALIEEDDIDFERNSKPVPVITQSVSSSLEERIKKRILTYDFDDIPRRIPDSVPEFTKSKKLEQVSETKSSKSLSEIYEEEYTASGSTNIDLKLEEAHKEIEKLFKSVVYKLDALSSWTFTPKQPKPSMTVVSDVAAITMEDAQPATMSTNNSLAPQEVYKPGESPNRDNTNRDELGSESNGNNSIININKSGLPISKAEMSREEKKRLRRRGKEKAKKMAAKKAEVQRAKAATSEAKGGKLSKAAVLETLRKGGNVTVIGSRGEKRTLEGKEVRDPKRIRSSNVKL